jgi:hypothetical protein
MPRKFKEFLYQRFWLCGPALFIIVGVFLLRLKGVPLVGIVTFGGGLAGAYYFLQKQLLGELELFERLFADFNRRYAKMQDRLEELRSKGGPLSRADSALLQAYFNLCAEEYLYYSSRVIDSRVWRAWCRGMLQYLEVPHVAAFWAEEESGDSYYGLTLREIEAGAQFTRSRRATTAFPSESASRRKVA